MSIRRVALLGTCGLIAGLAAVFAVNGWQQADRIASVVSALAAVGALGLAVWAVLPGRCPHPHGHESPAAAGTATALQTGTATADGPGSRANTGVTGGSAVPGGMTATRTGDARASGGGTANSGVAPHHHV